MSALRARGSQCPTYSPSFLGVSPKRLVWERPFLAFISIGAILPSVKRGGDAGAFLGFPFLGRCASLSRHQSLHGSLDLRREDILPAAGRLRRPHQVYRRWCRQLSPLSLRMLESNLALD